MSQTVKYHVFDYAVSAVCKKPRARCFLCEMLQPLTNMLVAAENKRNGYFECTVFMCNRGAYDVKKGKAAILDIMKQLCPQCQNIKQR